MFPRTLAFATSDIQSRSQNSCRSPRDQNKVTSDGRNAFLYTRSPLFTLARGSYSSVISPVSEPCNNCAYPSREPFARLADIARTGAVTCIRAYGHMATISREENVSYSSGKPALSGIPPHPGRTPFDAPRSLSRTRIYSICFREEDAVDS